MENTDHLPTKIIIGIVGDLCSGKSSCAQYLKDKFNFQIIHLDSLREQSKSSNDSMNESSVSKNLKDLTRDPNQFFYVIYPFTKIDQICEVLNKTSFRLIYVSASPKARYNNYIKKYSEANCEKFLDKDYEISSCGEFKKLKCMARCYLSNEKSLQDFHNGIDHMFNHFIKIFRPSWDDYFMSVAHMVAERSNCIKQKVGAVLVKNNRILSVGYNGTPAGMRNCYEGSCERCNSGVAQGVNLDKCYCVHAEENAV